MRSTHTGACWRARIASEYPTGDNPARFIHSLLKDIGIFAGHVSDINISERPEFSVPGKQNIDITIDL